MDRRLKPKTDALTLLEEDVGTVHDEGTGNEFCMNWLRS
jgi:hypothetical protein